MFAHLYSSLCRKSTVERRGAVCFSHLSLSINRWNWALEQHISVDRHTCGEVWDEWSFSGGQWCTSFNMSSNIFHTSSSVHQILRHCCILTDRRIQRSITHIIINHNLLYLMYKTGCFTGLEWRYCDSLFCMMTSQASGQFFTMSASASREFPKKKPKHPTDILRSCIHKSDSWNCTLDSGIWWIFLREHG